MVYIAHTAPTRFVEFCVTRRPPTHQLPPTTHRHSDAAPCFLRHSPGPRPTNYAAARYTRTRRCVSLLGLLCALNVSAQSIPLSEFRARRAALQKNLEGTIVLFGKTVGPDEVYGFLQEPNFYYLTGWTEPGAVVIVTKNDAVLLLPHRNPRAEIFTGHKAAASDENVKEVTGFDVVMLIEKLESQSMKALDSGEKVYALPRDRDSPQLITQTSLLCVTRAVLRRTTPL